MVRRQGGVARAGACGGAGLAVVTWLLAAAGPAVAGVRRRPAAGLRAPGPVQRAPALSAQRGPRRRPRPGSRGDRGASRPRPPPAVTPQNKLLLRQLRAEGELAEGEARALVDALVGESQLNRTREYALFMSELGRRQFWQESISLLADREQRDAKMVVEVYNSAMGACSKAGRWDQAVQILYSMRDKDVTPDMVSFNIALGACEEAREWRQVLSILDDMQQFRRRNFFTFNVSIGACVQGRQWERALDLIDEMLYFDVTPDWSIYNLGVVLAGDGQQWQIALGLLADMWGREVLPDALTYSAAISVCECSGRWQEGLRLLGDMRRKGFAPNAATCASVARTCRSAGQAALAEALEQRPPARGAGALRGAAATAA